MNRDCCFWDTDGRFRFRACAIIRYNDKLLFAKNPTDVHFATVGGGVHLNESTEDCVVREVFEETGMHTKPKRLAAVLENFFEGQKEEWIGTHCHIIEFVYLIEVNDISDCLNVSDDGEILRWIPIDKIKEFEIRPDTIVENIERLLNGKEILHLVETKYSKTQRIVVC